MSILSLYLCYNYITHDPLFSTYPMQPYCDTEKADGMFGTMVVQLPSDFDGACMKFDFSGLNGMTRFHTAFYADYLHELCEVTKGYRMCLMYNRVYSGDGAVRFQ